MAADTVAAGADIFRPEQLKAAAKAAAFLRVQSMFDSLRVKVPLANLMEVKS
jgi:hypothetical protein